MIVGLNHPLTSGCVICTMLYEVTITFGGHECFIICSQKL
jgi:hypothetical protein